VTVVVVVVVSVVAVGQEASRGAGDLDAPTRWLGWSTHDVTRGQWWRLFTPNLVNPANNGLHVHSSAAAHYAFSLLGLVALGIALERRIGGRWFLVTAFVSGLSAFTSLALTDPHGRAYDGGSSGIIAGIGGALVMLLWQHRRDSPTARRWWWTAAVVAALLFLVSTTWSANVNQVHAVSFAAGAAMALGLRSFRGLRTPARGIAVVLVVMSLAVAGIRTLQQPNPEAPRV
jgi:membrane associated rhomboid family serine protease